MEGLNSAGPLSPAVGDFVGAAVGLGWMGRDGMWITLWNCAKQVGLLVSYTQTLRRPEK